MTSPETRYARNGEVRIAYQVVGQGPFDLVFVPGFLSNLEICREDAGYAHLLQRLATFSRLIVLDGREGGLSDRIDARAPPSLDVCVDDVRAVMDAAGSGRAALLGASDGAATAILFAARHPARTRALVIHGGYAHFRGSVMGRNGSKSFCGRSKAPGAAARRCATLHPTAPRMPASRPGGPVSNACRRARPQRSRAAG
jgi:pimeloyl-ACP methyl ester carboxylesterase